MVGRRNEEKLSEAEFTLAITEWLLSQIRREYPNLGPEQSLLGRIGVDTRKWLPSDRKPASNGVFRIVTVGRLHPSKGHDVLLHAVARLVREVSRSG